MSRLRVLFLVYGFVGIVAAASPFLVRGGRAHAQGFDCRRAADAVERAICDTPELATLDSQLAGIWQKFQTDHPDQIATARKEGIVWWRGRKHCAEQADLIGCVRDAETARIVQLQAIRSPRETDAERSPAMAHRSSELSSEDTASLQSDTAFLAHASHWTWIAHPGAGPAGQAFMYQALARWTEVTDPYQQQFLQEAGPNASPVNQATGGSRTTVFEAVCQELMRQYKGDAMDMQLRRANALYNLSAGEISMHEAQAFFGNKYIKEDFNKALKEVK